MARDLWLPCSHNALLEQLRLLSAAGEAHSADDHARSARASSAGVRRWNERARLVIRVRPRSGTLDDPAKRYTGRGVQHWRGLRDTESGGGAAGALAARQTGVAHPIRERPPRSRSPLCDELVTAATGTRMETRTHIHHGPRTDGAVVSRQRGVV